MSVEIRTRFTGMTYIATVRGEKQTASCTIDARHAAEALARKLGLAPGLLQEQPDLLNPRERTTFTHPGDLLEEVAMADAVVQVLEEAPEKLCKKCDEHWPADSEFFFRQAAKPDGLSDICKARYAELPSVQKRNRDKHGRLLSVWEQLDLERTGSNTPMCM